MLTRFRQWFEAEMESQKIPDGYRGVLFILRGVPGVGKSHLGLRLVDGDKSKVFASDDWFDMQPGGYLVSFSLDKTAIAHRWNEERVRAAMQRGISPIVVDNTNLRMRFARPFVDMAKQYQYHVEIKESDSPWWSEISELLKDKKTNEKELAAWATKLSKGFKYNDKYIKNTHGVQPAAIQDMFRMYYPYTLDDVERKTYEM